MSLEKVKPKLNKCYNPGCNKLINFEKGYFCDDFCKAGYHGITVDELKRPRNGIKTTIDERVAILKKHIKNDRIRRTNQLELDLEVFQPVTQSKFI